MVLCAGHFQRLVQRGVPAAALDIVSRIYGNVVTQAVLRIVTKPISDPLNGLRVCCDSQFEVAFIICRRLEAMCRKQGEADRQALHRARGRRQQSCTITIAERGGPHIAITKPRTGDQIAQLLSHLALTCIKRNIAVIPMLELYIRRSRRMTSLQQREKAYEAEFAHQ